MTYYMQRGETISLGEMVARNAARKHAAETQKATTAYEASRTTLLAKNDMRGLHMAMRGVR